MRGRPKSLRRKYDLHIHVDEELVYFFKALMYSPTEGRTRNKMSELVEGLLRKEKDRIIQETKAEGANTSDQGNPRALHNGAAGPQRGLPQGGGDPQ